MNFLQISSCFGGGSGRGVERLTRCVDLVSHCVDYFTYFPLDKNTSPPLALLHVPPQLPPSLASACFLTA